MNDVARNPVATALAFAELGKLRLSGLAVVAVIAGLLVADGSVTPAALIGTTCGTMLVAIAGNALNMYIERDNDRRMGRTLRRPLPAGRLAPMQVLVFGCVVVVLGLAVLWLTTNALATALCAAIFATYVLVYTPLKQRTTLNTLVGAIPGALPPLVGYAAGAGRLDARAAVLFLILFLWQIPHFLAIAWRYRDDYRAGGMRMLPGEAPGSSTGLLMVVYACALVAASLFAYTVGIAGVVYVVAASALGLVFLFATAAAAVAQNDRAMRLCFLVSIVYLPLLLAVMVLDRVER